MKFCVDCYYYANRRNDLCCRKHEFSVDPITGGTASHGEYFCSHERQDKILETDGGIPRCGIEAKFFKSLELTFVERILSCFGVEYDYIDRERRKNK